MTYQLNNDPPKPQPWRGENRKAEQRKLLSGLDCLPGQRDLFDTDGERDHHQKRTKGREK